MLEWGPRSCTFACSCCGRLWRPCFTGCGKRASGGGGQILEEPLQTVKKRTIYRILSLSMIAAVWALVLGAQQSATLIAPRSGYSFPQKQTLTYAVDWRVFTVATAQVRFEQQGDRERLTVDAETAGAMNLIYRISDHFQTIFDRQRGCTYEFDRQTLEGRRQIASTLKLDYAQGKSVLEEKNLVSGQSKRLEAPIPGCSTDLLTGLFYAASQPMEVGKSFVVPVVEAKGVIPVTMRVEGREEIKTTLGTFKTIRVQPTADDGMVKNRGNIWIWYTDDERHLPVQMRARSFWGTITFRLTGNEAK
jgi:hypothetical protein